MNPTALERALRMFKTYQCIRTFLNHENNIQYDASVNLQEKRLLNNNNFTVLYYFCVTIFRQFYNHYRLPLGRSVRTIFQSSFRYWSNFILQCDQVYLYVFFFFSSSLKQPRTCCYWLYI